MKNYLPFWIMIGILVSLDQLTKISILKNFQEFEKLTVIPGFFNLVLIYNKGAAFGMLSNLPQNIRAPFFFILPIVAIIYLLWLFFKGNDQSLLMKLSICLVISGALGNLIDRLLYDQVVDFLQFYIKEYYWPSFNVADSCISVGIALLFIATIRWEKKIKKLKATT